MASPLPALQEKIDALKPYEPGDFEKRAKVVAATPFFKTPVYKHKEENYGLKDSSLGNQLPKSRHIEQQQKLIEVLEEWLGQNLGKVWISDTLSTDLNLFMSAKVPKSCSILQAFFIGKGVPCFVLTLYTPPKDPESNTLIVDTQSADSNAETTDRDAALADHSTRSPDPKTRLDDSFTNTADLNSQTADPSTETAELETPASIHKFTVFMVKCLTLALLDFCHCEFAILPCTLDMSKLTVEALREELKTRKEQCQRFYDGSIRLKAATFRTLTRATVVLQGASYNFWSSESKVKTSPHRDQVDDEWLLLLDKPWRDLVHHVIETLTDQSCKYHITIPLKSYKKVKVAVLEAAKRVGIREQVIILTPDNDVCAWVTKLRNQCKKQQNVDLRIVVKSADEASASLLVISTQYSTVYFYTDRDGQQAFLRESTRQSKRTKLLPERKKPCPKPTIVYIRIHDVIQDIGVVEDMLTSKVNSPGVELTPTKTSVRRSDRLTYCTLTCDSKALAKKLRYLILKDRDQSRPLIDCSFDDFEAEEIQHQQNEKAKADLRKIVEHEFDARSEKVVRAHDQKVKETQEKIDRARENVRDLYTAKKTREEIAALEHKLEELQLQKREFTTALDGFRQKLDSLLKKDNYETEVRSLRKALGVECCRLERALPIYARRQDIVQVVQQNPVSVLLAETGSGKSTQVVQYLLDAGLGERGAIVCTQPRKVAAVSLATHVAQELAGNVGKEVGYKAGSRVKTSATTKVIYMTDHALLNECLMDPELKAFSCVVVDEAHERSLFTDLLLTMVKRCVARRPDLRVVITSATIDPQVFVNFFGSCPVMRVSGRTFPVDVVWQDAASEESQFENYVEAAVNKAVEIHEKEPPGDILVFLTSALEIQRSCDLFQQKVKDRTDYTCFQLHGQLQADEQQKVFEPPERNKRKVAFATNCAETSITIDGIKYVVDTGVAKEMRYDAKRNIRSLNVTVISRSSAEQRKGRAGRTAPGKCYRLYSQRSFQAMDALSLPEILKTHLGHALLKLAELGVTPDMYDFVQSPSQEAIDAALVTLRQLGAMRDGVITDTGKWIARLPFDPKLGLMTLHGRDCGLLYDVIVLAALVSAGSGLFYRGLTDEEHKKFDKSKIKFSHQGGDSLTSLEVYKAWQAVAEKEKNKWCVNNSINAKVIRGVRDTVNDVCRLLKNEAKVEVTHQFSEDESTADALRKILFICNASNLCHYLGREKAGYFAAGACRQVHFHPSSAICSLASFPQWVVYDQLLQTSRDFIIGVSPVDDAWLQEVSRERFGFDVEQVSRKKLQKVFTQPAGFHAFFAMVGPHYTKLRQLQEGWEGPDSSVMVVEASREAGEVRVFCTDAVDSVEHLTRELTAEADRAVKDVQREVGEVAVGSEKSGLRVVLGQGGQVTDILMPNEARKIFITKPTEDAPEETIRQKFQAYGEIKYCCPFTGGRTSSQAATAAEATKDDDQDVAQLVQRRSTLHDALFKAKISWNRRPARDFGFVSVSPAYFSDCLLMGSLLIGGSPVRIKEDRVKKNSLFLTKLPVDVTEDLIKRSLLHALGVGKNTPGIVKRVSVPRANVEIPDRNQLSCLANQISREFERNLTASTVQVTVYPPETKKSIMFFGEAQFNDPFEGLAACKTLQGVLRINGTKVAIEPYVIATLRVPGHVYNACREELMEVTSRLKDMGVEVDIEPQKADNYLIRLKANDTDDIVRARAYLNDVTKGDVLDCGRTPELSHLLTSAGRQMLKETEKATLAYVSVDNRLKTISIRGTAEARANVRLAIESYLTEVLTGEGQEVLLRGGGRPPGLLKALHNKYGEQLDDLRHHAALHHILVDYRRHTLKLSGPPASIEKAKQAVEEVDKTLRAAGFQSSADDEDSPDCAACFCPIDRGDLYRLETCAHPFCNGCIVRQVAIAVKDHRLPIVCCYEGCELPLAWRDFNNLSRLGHLKLPDLASSALSAYVFANRDKAHFCTTPDCPMVYRVTSEDHPAVFRCPECNVHTCTACHEQGHDGMKCGILRSCKETGSGVDNWVLEDRKNRRACPGCRSPVEKMGGGNKMHCTACGTIFCWVCTKKFVTQQACYDHLAKEHDGIFALEDVLRYR